VKFRRFMAVPSRTVLAGALLLAAIAGDASAQPQPKRPPPPPPAAKDIINSVEGANPAVEDMAAGKYPPMARGESLPLGQIQRAWDGSAEGAGVQVFRYAPDKVMKLRSREFMTTTIILPSWETIDHADLADDFVFDIGQPRPNIIKLRPKHVGADSTLTLLGESGNVYAFYIRSEGHNSANISDVVVHVRAEAPFPSRPSMKTGADFAATPAAAVGTPKGEGRSAARSARSRELIGEKDPDFVKPIAFDPTRLRYDFSMSGDKTIAPERVFTDGTFTWFDYGSRWDTADLPAVYRVVDGIDTPINTRVQGTALVAEVSGAFTLRNGQRVVCVRPEGWEPKAEYRAPPAARSSRAAPPVALGGGEGERSAQTPGSQARPGLDN
jgi:ComB9 competence protein